MNNNTNIVWMIIVVLIALGIIVWFAFMNVESPDTGLTPTPQPIGTPPPAAPSPTPANPQNPTPQPTPSPAAATKEFTVTGQKFSFAPSSLTVKQGDKVRITFKNADGFHDLKIDEFKVATKQINGGEQEVVEFIADKKGSFEYYCSVGNHRAMGMKGTLVVE